MQTKNLNQVATVMDALMEPLGEAAPDCRHFIVDYKVEGADYHRELTAWLPKGISDDTMVEAILSEFEAEGRTVTAVAELTGGNVSILYLCPDGQVYPPQNI